MYYREPYLSRMKSVVEDVIISGRSIEILLEDTLLYPGGGGQPHDTGRILGKKWSADITLHRVSNGKVWHIGTLFGSVIPEPGEIVEVILNWKRRYDFMQQHTAQHLLSATFFRLYDLETEGFQIFDDHSKIEFRTESLSKEMLETVEIVTNEVAKKGLEVTTYITSRGEVQEELRKAPKEGLKFLRIVSIGDYDSVPCGGIHVRNTKEVLPIKIIRAYKKTSSIWRVEFVAGYRAFRVLNDILEDYWESLGALNRSAPPLIDAVRAFEDEITKRISEERIWKYKLVETIVKFARASAVKIGREIVAVLEDIPWELRDSLVKEASAHGITLLVGICKEGKFLVFSSRGLAKEILQHVSKLYKIKGGGSRNLVQGVFLENVPSSRDLLNVVMKVLR